MNKKSLYACLVLLLFPVFLFWYQGSILNQALTFQNILLAFGRLFGLMATIGVLLQFLMMGRTLWIEKVFGLDKLTNIHRLNGYLTLSFLILHPVFITLAYKISSKTSFLNQFLLFLTDYDDVFKAFLGLILFVTIIFSSVYVVKRKLKYEWWYWIHLFTYLAVLLAWSHQLEAGRDFARNRVFALYWYFLYIFVFGNVILFRFALPIFRFFYHDFRVDKVIRENRDVVSIYIIGRNLSKFSAVAGQFIIVRFFDKKRFWQAHPFSLSSCPNSEHIRITVKDSGDFTHKIDGIKKGTKVLIDGPYGTFTQKVKQKNKILFIAGGIGITPINALIEEMAKDDKNEMILLYSSKTEKDMVFLRNLEDVSGRSNLKIVCFVTEDPKFNGEKGRVNREKIKKYVPNVRFRDIYICGPWPMIKVTQEILSGLNVSNDHVHFEKFAL
ncbi:hypothetical protein A2690_04695 [Candidatus Roizmanbacteria bacterium RIFCSPHIGHO2_01_FULL_39_12b]|uniref:FAD-binding FR-type domain-containing protein n=1 Tax=Candidatus Roizmanbacteria bacterium RIFCSPHIGHO2_01_FULL_39_12b TaxID=1802030 RepID=A0A1F7GAL6_9BACT|nr:MAG: hypothetical protein A2690_04695 [Candidatus Roizmanbacteria bacterium RIFCSPHIGHO2_01_FULL_39_12b]OGK46749.1 MAG: hypothetical protein A3B46_02320 [Candidatus Roizmanbacteria bacterium RIFCSPLOWO2_01_FULL_39_19]